MLKTGFFDSIKGDRKYNSRDIATMFDGIIVDGIYAQIGEKFSVNVDEEDPMTIVIGTGQAWLSHTKILNTSPYRIKFDPVSSTIKYTIIIEVNEPNRTAEISYINENEEFIKNDNYIHQYRLAYVTLGAGSTKITQANIASKIGFAIPDGIPYVTCPLEPFPADETLKQWVAQWTEFYEGVNESFTTFITESAEAFMSAQSDREEDYNAFKLLATNWLNSTDTDWNTWFTNTQEEWDTWYNSIKDNLENMIDSAVDTHNESDTAHSDIRDLVSDLTTRLNALADSDDTTLDQLSEIVAYIKDNRDLIDSITTSKVSVSDIVDNLTSSYIDKPLSANQGNILKNLIGEVNTKMTISYALKSSVEDLKKSVSDGKTLVADAITEKGVTTAADATFAMMAENISQIENGTGESINLQESVTVKSTTKQQTIYPDEGYDAISQVVVESIQLEEQSVPKHVLMSPMPNASPYLLTPSSDEYDGIKYVSLNRLSIQNKTITPTDEEQTVLPDEGYDMLAKVVVEPAELILNELMLPSQVHKKNVQFNGDGIHKYYLIWGNAVNFVSKGTFIGDARLLGETDVGWSGTILGSGFYYHINILYLPNETSGFSFTSDYNYVAIG